MNSSQVLWISKSASSPSSVSSCASMPMVSSFFFEASLRPWFLLFLCPLVFLGMGRSEADLGILIWWGCKYNGTRRSRKFFATTPTFYEPRHKHPCYRVQKCSQKYPMSMLHSNSLARYTYGFQLTSNVQFCKKVSNCT